MSDRRMRDFESGFKGNVSPNVKLGDLAARYLYVRKTWRVQQCAVVGAAAAGPAESTPAAAATGHAVVSPPAPLVVAPASSDQSPTTSCAVEAPFESAATGAATTQLPLESVGASPAEGQLPLQAAATGAAGSPPAGSGTPTGRPQPDPALPVAEEDVDLGEVDSDDGDEEGDEITGGAGDSDDCAGSETEEAAALDVQPITIQGSSPTSVIDTEDDVQHQSGRILGSLEPVQFRCTCPRYWECGICYHIVMHCALLMDDDLTADVEQLPIMRRPGRKRNAVACLERQP
eukprot:GHVU01069832.1.p1 GENE.GHVU01069832.1~~GHVU01069832.1.p1  ORF type:complete len:303 (-),score=36.01 GHVU01069832.1:1373-2239(-)